MYDGRQSGGATKALAFPLLYLSLYPYDLQQIDGIVTRIETEEVVKWFKCEIWDSWYAVYCHMLSSCFNLYRAEGNICH